MERSYGGYNTAFRGRYLNSGWSHIGYEGRGKKALGKNGSVYIHFLQQHYNSSGLNNLTSNVFSDTFNLFETFQKRAQALALTDYMAGVENSAKEKLSSFLSVDDNFLTKLDQGIREQLSKNVNLDRGQALQTYVEKIGKVEDIAKRLEKMKDDIKQLFTFLDEVTEITEKMEKGTGKIVFANFLKKILKKGKKSKNVKELQSVLTEELKKAQGSQIGNSEYKESLHLYQNFLNNLFSFNTSNDFYKTATEVSKSLQNNYISKGLGEITAIVRDSIIDGTVNRAIKNSLTGNMKTENIFYENDKNTFKSDIVFKNKKVLLNINGNNIQFTIDLGTSVKFYKNQTYKVNTSGVRSGVNTLSIQSGSGGSLQEFFTALQIGEQQKYQIYNFLTFNGLAPEFRNLMLQRQFFRLFATGSDTSSLANSSKGKIDFSTYILANGQLISMYQLFQFITKFIKTSYGNIEKYINVYLKRSDATRKKGSLKEIHLNQNWMFLNQWEREQEDKRGKASLQTKSLALAWKRARILNDDINKATIHATLHLHNIIKAYASGNIKTKIN